MSSAKDIFDILFSHEFLTIFAVCLLVLIVLRLISARRKAKHHHHHHHTSRLSYRDEGAIFSTMLWFLVGMIIVAFAFYFLYVSLHWLQSP